MGASVLYEEETSRTSSSYGRKMMNGESYDEGSMIRGNLVLVIGFGARV